MHRRSFELWCKNVIDRIGALLLLAILAPILVAIGLIIAVADRRPVMFFQDRLGKDQQSFRIWKFRTMVVDADSYLDKAGKPTRNRVTRIGQILRRFSLDELPQIINILKGEMSFVGPRPALTEHIERYSEQQKRRLEMKPGVTGLAQVCGRNTLKWSKRIEMDVNYIDNFSLLLDLKILLKTVVSVFQINNIVMDRNSDEVDDLAKHPK